jgi:uncharacterized protein
MYSGPRDLAELLLAHGANVNAKDNSGTSAVDLAVWFGRRDMVELLLAHGADPNAVCPLCYVHGVEVRGATPLKLALENGHADIAELLREHGGHE